MRTIIEFYLVLFFVAGMSGYNAKQALWFMGIVTVVVVLIVAGGRTSGDDDRF